jgi:hypothetical protein
MIHVKEKRVSNEFEWFQAMGFTALWCPPGYQGETRCVGWGVLASTTTTEETAEVGEGDKRENGVFLN